MDNTNISVVMSDHKSLACSCKGLIWFDVAWPSTLFFHHLRCIDQNFQLTDSIQPNRQNMAHYKALNGCMSTSLRSISLICSKSGLPAIHPYWWIRLGQQFSCAALADWNRSTAQRTKQPLFGAGELRAQSCNKQGSSLWHTAFEGAVMVG